MVTDVYNMLCGRRKLNRKTKKLKYSFYDRKPVINPSRIRSPEPPAHGLRAAPDLNQCD